MEDKGCSTLIQEIITYIKTNNYYKAITRLDFLKDNFTLDDVENVLDNTFFSDLDNFISDLMCFKSIDVCCESCSNGDCCKDAGTCIVCLIIGFVLYKGSQCIPGCGALQEICVECACAPCHWCMEDCVPCFCEGVLDKCCNSCC